MMNDTNDLCAGARCLVGPNGYWWSPGTIHSVDDDGTFTIEFDKKEFSFWPYWYGITRSEISVNDEFCWPEVFCRLARNSPSISHTDLLGALKNVGYQYEDEGFNGFWKENCAEVLGDEAVLPTARLNMEQSYKLLLKGKCSAKRLADPRTNRFDYLKLYWNQTRMAGRHPDEINRAVTLADAFEALGVNVVSPDTNAESILNSFQDAHGFELPVNLRRFLGCRNIKVSVQRSVPNSPELVMPGDADSEFLRSPVFGDAVPDFALTMMVSHSGDHAWAAAFDRGDEDAEIYITAMDGNWTLTAPSIGMFFWDLAQTGLIKRRNSRHRRRKSLERTDIGVKPKSSFFDALRQSWHR